MNRAANAPMEPNDHVEKERLIGLADRVEQMALQASECHEKVTQIEECIATMRKRIARDSSISATSDQVVPSKPATEIASLPDVNRQIILLSNRLDMVFSRLEHMS